MGGIQDAARTGKGKLIYSGSASKKVAVFSLRDTIVPLHPYPLPTGTERRGLYSFLVHSLQKEAFGASQKQAITVSP